VLPEVVLLADLGGCPERPLGARYRLPCPEVIGESAGYPPSEAPRAASEAPRRVCWPVPARVLADAGDASNDLPPS